MPTSRYHTSSGGHRHLYNRGVYRAGILHHNTTVSSGTNTYSGQYYSTNADGVDCRTWIEVFFRTFAILAATASFITALIVLSSVTSVSDVTKRVLQNESDPDEIASLYPYRIIFPDTVQLEATLAVSIFTVVVFVFAVVPQIPFIFVRVCSIAKGKHRITLLGLILDAVVVALCVPCYSIACGLASKLYLKWSPWVSIIRLEDDYDTVGTISISLLISGIASGVAGAFHLGPLITILVNLYLKQKKYFPDDCCFSCSKNTEEEAAASSASVDQNRQAGEVSVPVPALENAGPTQSKDPQLPSSPAVKLANTETELRVTAPPSYHELYGVQTECND